MDNNMFTLCSFFYSILLTILYFGKKRVSSYESKLYKKIIILNILSAIFALMSYYSIKYSLNIMLIRFSSKGLLILYFLWISELTRYVYVITHPVESSIDVKKFYKKQRIFMFVCMSIFILLITILPIEYNPELYNIYTYGSSANVAYVGVAIYWILWLVFIFTNLKKVNSKKSLLPAMLFIISCPIIVLIQRMNPAWLLVTFLQSFVTLLMYFTIENPDMKMLKEIQSSKEFAEQANTEKAMFLYNTSQELKSPVNAIQERCEELLQEQDINEIINGIKDIKFAAKRLSSTISGTLDMNKMQATNIEIKVSRYSTKMLFQEMVSISKLNMKDKSIDFRVNLDDNIPEYLMGDSIRLKQIITTIMNNAIKHTEKGFIELGVSSVIKHDVCRLIITIEDSGEGIESKKLETLFYNKDDEEVLDEDKLNNVQDTRERLSVVKILTNLIGGTVIVNSELGKGSKFTVVLDQQIAETKKTSTMIAIEKLSSNKRILVVDDEEDSLKQITKVLNKYDVNVDTALWGQECLEKIRSKQKYDLILLDEDMPRLNGIKTFEKLKIEDNFNIPVIIMINSNHIDYKERYIYNGFSGCIVKPIKKTDMDKILKKFVKLDE